MVAETDAQNRHSVVCLFCGAPAPLSTYHERRLSAKDDEDRHSPVLLIRCPVCFKEAPYRLEKAAVATA